MLQSFNVSLVIVSEQLPVTMLMRCQRLVVFVITPMALRVLPTAALRAADIKLTTGFSNKLFHSSILS